MALAIFGGKKRKKHISHFPAFVKNKSETSYYLEIAGRRQHARKGVVPGAKTASTTKSLSMRPAHSMIFCCTRWHLPYVANFRESRG